MATIERQTFYYHTQAEADALAAQNTASNDGWKYLAWEARPGVSHGWVVKVIDEDGQTIGVI